MTDSITTFLPQHTLQDCKGSNHCLSVCAKSCVKPQTIVNGEQCKRYGTDSSQKAAKQACDNALVSEAVVHVQTASACCVMSSTRGPIPPKCISGSDLLKTPAYATACVHRPANLPQLYCNGGQQRTSALGARRYFPVSLGQCANIAYGTCQEHGMTRWRSPCWYAFNGYRSCNKEAFMKFYTGERGHRCCWQHQCRQLSTAAVAWVNVVLLVPEQPAPAIIATTMTWRPDSTHRDTHSVVAQPG